MASGALGAAQAPGDDQAGVPSPQLRYAEGVPAVPGDTAVMPLRFKQGSPSGAPGGPGDITAWSVCADFDQDNLAFDDMDSDGDGVPDSVNFLLPPTHEGFVVVDRDRVDCELLLAALDLSDPLAVLADGFAAEIEFTIDSEPDPAADQIFVGCGDPASLSFADTLAVSQPGLCEPGFFTVGCGSDAECDDGLFCNGEETCNDLGLCLDGAAPCADEEQCDEELDSCGPAGEGEPEVSIFSVETNTFSPDVGVLRHYNVYQINDAGTVFQSVPTFLTFAAGLDAVSVYGNRVVFSTLKTKFLAHAGGSITARPYGAYLLDLNTGIISEIFAGYTRAGLDAVHYDPASNSLIFSTEKIRFISYPGGNIVLRPANAYRIELDSGVVSLAFDGLAAGLSSLDAVAELSDGRFAISTRKNTFVVDKVLRNYNAYLYNEQDGTFELVLDGDALGVRSLDAISEPNARRANFRANRRSERKSLDEVHGRRSLSTRSGCSLETGDSPCQSGAFGLRADSCSSR